MTESTPTRRIRVAAVNDYEIVVQGLASMLSQYPDRIEVADAIVIGEQLDRPVDVALYDNYGRRGLAAEALAALMSMPEVGAVALFSLDLHPTFIEESRAVGARGFISKALRGDAIADAVCELARTTGEVIAVPESALPASPLLDWPAKEYGLTERESQVLVLLGEGLTNREIATALYLSSETVKAYVSTIYRKLNLRNRVQATNYIRDSGKFNKFLR